MKQPTKGAPTRHHRPTLYPFLFGLYSILALLSTNTGKVFARDIVRSTACIFVVLIGLFVLLWVLFRSPERAALACLVNTFLFFSFGHVYGLGMQNLPVNVFLAVWAAIAILGTWWVLRKTRAPWRFTQMLNIFTIILVLLPAVNIAFRAVKDTGRAVSVSGAEWPDGGEQLIAAQNPSIPKPVAGPASRTAQTEQPDIYYLILDGYGREDVLRDLYAYDNSAFVQALQERGFYVAEESHSNYSSTLLSLSSSLNTGYLDVSDLTSRTGAADNSPLTQLIMHSYVRAFLEARGYQTVAFNNNYSVSGPDGADLVVSSGGMNNFEFQLVDTTLLMLAGYRLYADAARQAVQTSLERAPTLRDPNTPRFIFVHVLSPHPPFLFGPNGEKLPFFGYAGDGSSFYGGPEKYKPLYAGQLTYLNELVLQTIDRLLVDTDHQPVIIIQGDHGPAAYLDAPGGPCVRERISILNAYYLPGKGNAGLYPGITPVNTFRVILNAYFDANLGILEDRAYLSPLELPYQLEDVTDRLDECRR